MGNYAKDREKKDKALYVMCEASFLDSLRRHAHLEKTLVSKMVRRWLKEAMDSKHIEHTSEVLPNR